MTAHVHGPECAHGCAQGADPGTSTLPRPVPRAEAEILERCRAALMHRAGLHTSSPDVPDMTTREASLPVGTGPVELGTIVVALDRPTPARRARLTTAAAAAIGLPSLRMRNDTVPGHLSYELGVSANLDMSRVVAAWRRIADVDGASYVRIEGLSPQGLWVVEHRPDGDDGPEPWRFVLSGPGDAA